MLKFAEKYLKTAKHMKKILLFISLFLVKYSFSQINVSDIGKKTIYDVKSAYSISPCEATGELIITYCVENGSRLSYLFKNKILDGIMTMTAFSTRYAAEKELEAEVSKKKASIGIEPIVSGGKTWFFTPDSPIFVTYSVEYVNQTYYMVFYVARQ